MSDHEKCIAKHLAAAIDERLTAIRDSEAAKALQLPDVEGFQITLAAYAALAILRGDWSLPD